MEEFQPCPMGTMRQVYLADLRQILNSSVRIRSHLREGEAPRTKETTGPDEGGGGRRVEEETPEESEQEVEMIEPVVVSSHSKDEEEDHAGEMRNGEKEELTTSDIVRT